MICLSFHFLFLEKQHLQRSKRLKRLYANQPIFHFYWTNITALTHFDVLFLQTIFGDLAHEVFFVCVLCMKNKHFLHFDLFYSCAFASLWNASVITLLILIANVVDSPNENSKLHVNVKLMTAFCISLWQGN